MCTHACSVTSVVPDTLQPCILQPTRLLCPWDSPSKNTRVGFHALLRGSSQPRDQSRISCITGGFLTTEPLRKPLSLIIDVKSVSTPMGLNSKCRQNLFTSPITCRATNPVKFPSRPVCVTAHFCPCSPLPQSQCNSQCKLVKGLCPLRCPEIHQDITQRKGQSPHNRLQGPR